MAQSGWHEVMHCWQDHEMAGLPRLTIDAMRGGHPLPELARLREAWRSRTFRIVWLGLDTTRRWADRARVLPPVRRDSHQQAVVIGCVVSYAWRDHCIGHVRLAAAQRPVGEGSPGPCRRTHLHLPRVWGGLRLTRMAMPRQAAAHTCTGAARLESSAPYRFDSLGRLAAVRRHILDRLHDRSCL